MRAGYFALAIMVAGTAASLAPDPVAGADLEALRAEVRAVFEAQCVSCHQEDPARPDRKIEKFGYILDFERLEASDYIVAGDPEASKLYTSVKFDEMPEFANIGMTRPVPADGKQAIFDWIAALGSN